MVWKIEKKHQAASKHWQSWSSTTTHATHITEGNYNPCRYSQRDKPACNRTTTTMQSLKMGSHMVQPSELWVSWPHCLRLKEWIKDCAKISSPKNLILPSVYKRKIEDNPKHSMKRIVNKEESLIYQYDLARSGQNSGFQRDLMGHLSERSILKIATGIGGP